MVDFTQRRHAMVERQIAGRGLRSAHVLQAMESVAREAFVPAEVMDQAYRDRPLSIGEGQTISQPYMVALMVDALELGGADHVLEIGAGSGYAAAVMAQIAVSVVALERIEALAAQARRNIVRAGYRNVDIICGDGTLGWAPGAPYDAILVSAGAPCVPTQLLQQLKIGGRLVVPVGDRCTGQTLMRVVRTGAQAWETRALGPVMFVPLIGAAGWPDEA